MEVPPIQTSRTKFGKFLVRKPPISWDSQAETSTWVGVGFVNDCEVPKNHGTIVWAVASTNPFEKYANVKLDHETPSFGVKMKNIWVATTQLYIYLHKLVVFNGQIW